MAEPAPTVVGRHACPSCGGTWRTLTHEPVTTRVECFDPSCRGRLQRIQPVA